MAKRTKYNHKSLITSYQASPNKSIYPGMIVDFRYSGDNIFDKIPLIYLRIV